MHITCYCLPRRALLALCAVTVAALSPLAFSDTLEERLQSGDSVILKLNRGQRQSNLENMRKEFPFLADATQAYALGDVWSRKELDDRTRQLAAVAAFAAIGETVFMKVHAGYALNVGVSEAELKEIIYLVTVPAGFPKAIRASQVMSELFAERRAASSNAQPGTVR